FRRSAVGFIFQQFYLMPYLSAYDNIRTALALRGVSNDGKIGEIAQRLGIADRLAHRPAELSVGEQQRVAMARTLVCEPGIILADESTGNLDAANRDIIAACLAEEHERGRTIVLATHEERLIELGTRTLELYQGKIQEAETMIETKT
ncbi:MAG: ATP-binding cassette domain-containing protein, partial [Candidatus Hydrogenedentota bacterium]